MKDQKNQPLISLLISAAHKFRLGKEAEGSVQFRECINLLEPMLNNSIKENEMTLFFPAMLAAQERFDWLSLADYLEFDIQAYFVAFLD